MFLLKLAVVLIKRVLKNKQVKEVKEVKEVKKVQRI